MSSRLTGMLRRRGLDAGQVDDVVQEVAVRVLVNELPFADADDLYAWAAPVARNLHVDLLRARSRTADGEDLGFIAASTDVEHEVERRMVFEDALRALALLGDADRTAILASVNGTPAPSDPGRIAVQRHRARRRLRLLLGSALGAISALRAGRHRTVRLAAVPVSSAVLLPALLATVLPAQPHSGAVPLDPPTRSESAAVRTVGSAGRVFSPSVARPPARRPGGPAGTAQQPPAAALEHKVVVTGPDGSAAGISEGSASQLLCLRGLPVVGRRCVVARNLPRPDVGPAEKILP